MISVINLDLGPNVLGYTTQVAGEMVCVLSPKTADDRAVQERVKRYMKGQGRDCQSCGGCPVGQAK